MRAFLALLPDRDSALAIDDWRSRAWPHIGRAVPVQRLHLTLCFLGEVASARIESLARSLDESPAPAHPFGASGTSLQLDTPGWRADSAVTWLEPALGADTLAAIVARLRGQAGRAGMRVDKRPFRAHVTLARGVVQPPPAPLEAPSIGARFGPVTLIESRLGPNGPHYEAVASWR